MRPTLWSWKTGDAQFFVGLTRRSVAIPISEPSENGRLFYFPFYLFCLRFLLLYEIHGSRVCKRIVKTVINIILNDRMDRWSIVQWLNRFRSNLFHSVLRLFSHSFRFSCISNHPVCRLTKIWRTVEEVGGNFLSLIKTTIKIVNSLPRNWRPTADGDGPSSPESHCQTYVCKI